MHYGSWACLGPTSLCHSIILYKSFFVVVERCVKSSVTKAMYFFFYFFLFFILDVLSVVGNVATAHQSEWLKNWSPPGHLGLSVSISTVITPQFQPNHDSAAALTSGRGSGSCGTVSLLARSSWLHEFVGNVRRSWRFLKWPEGLSMRQEAHVYKIAKKKNQDTLPLASCLPSCTAIQQMLSYRPGCYWNDGGVIDYLPTDSPFFMRVFAFPLQNWSCLQPTWRWQNKVWELVHEFKSHVNNEICKVLVAYVHLQAKFEAWPTKVFLVITLNV